MLTGTFTQHVGQGESLVLFSYTWKEASVFLSHGGQGKSMAPPHTR